MSGAKTSSFQLQATGLALTVVAAAALLSTDTQAQVAVRAAGADGRFTIALDPKTAVPGFPARQVGVFRQSLNGLTDRLAAMPEVNAPSAPMCMRVSSWIEVQSERGLLEASVDVSRPVIVDGRCTDLLGATVQVWLNRADTLLTSRLAKAASPEGEPWYVLPITREDTAGFAAEDDGDQIEVFTHGRAPFLLPVTWAEFSGGGGAEIWAQADYDAWLAHDYRDLLEAARRENAANGSGVPAGMRAEILAAVDAGFQAQAEMMRSMIGQPRRQIEEMTGRRFSQPPQAAGAGHVDSDPGQLTCWIEDRAQPGADCAPDQKLVKVNPEYFDAVRPEHVQLVLVRTPERPQGEDAIAYQERRAIWDAMDRQALGRMVR